MLTICHRSAKIWRWIGICWDILLKHPYIWRIALCIHICKIFVTQKPIILTRRAETSAGSYLRRCRICLHLAGTTSPSRTSDGTLPPKRPSDLTLDEAHMAPPGVCDCSQKWGLLKIRGGLKQINIHQSVISSYPRAKRQNKIMLRVWYLSKSSSRDSFLINLLSENIGIAMKNSTSSRELQFPAPPLRKWKGWG